MYQGLATCSLARADNPGNLFSYMPFSYFLRLFLVHYLASFYLILHWESLNKGDSEGDTDGLV